MKNLVLNINMGNQNLLTFNVPSHLDDKQIIKLAEDFKDAILNADSSLSTYNLVTRFVDATNKYAIINNTLAVLHVMG